MTVETDGLRMMRGAEKDGSPLLILAWEDETAIVELHLPKRQAFRVITEMMRAYEAIFGDPEKDFLQ